MDATVTAMLTGILRTQGLDEATTAAILAKVGETPRAAVRLDDAHLLAKWHIDSALREDAQTVFFARQLEEIDAQLYEMKYARMEAFELVSTKTIGAGKETYTWRLYDSIAIAKVISNYASGVPRADVAGQEFSSRIRSYGIGYGWNIQELRAAMDAGLPLDAAKAMAARRGLNEALNVAALMGNAEFGIIGLFNQPNASTYTVPVGASASTLWMGTPPSPVAKTSAEILNDMFGIVDSIPFVTKEIEHAKRLLLPYSQLRYISRVPYTLAGVPLAKSILEWFQQQRPGIEVRGALYLDNAGSAGNTQSGYTHPSRMVAYDPDRTNVEWILPIPFEALPPERKGLEWEVINHARTGSVVLRFPLTCSYGDGI